MTATADLQSVYQGIDYATISMGELLNRIAARFPDNEAVVMIDRPVRLRYRELRETAANVAKALIRLGVQPGDKVAIWATNVPEYIILQFGIPMAGAVWVTINIRALRDEVQYLLERSDTVALFFTSGYRDLDYVQMLREMAPELASATPGQLHSAALPRLRTAVFIPRHGEERRVAGAYTFAELVELGRSVPDEVLAARTAAVQPDDVASIQFTSGTTGKPKGVMLTHRNMVLNAHHTALAQKITERDRFVMMGPMFHCAPNVLISLCAVTRGATIVPLEQYDPRLVLEAIQRERITVINGAPTMFVQVLQHPDFGRYDLSSLRTGFMASAPCPVELVKEVIERMGVPEFTICYGLTETSPLITHTTTEAPFEKRVSTVGRPLPGVEVRIVDPNTLQDVPVGQPGELWARGYVVTKGYYRDPEATARTFVEGGWCRTGDLASMDEEGYVNIRGRLKDIIIRGGENIAPTEIEDVLYAHPKVKEAAVVGVPSETWGEEVAAFIQLKEGVTADPEEFREFCRGRLAHYKIPRYVFLIDQFPAVASGKIQKFKLREIAIRELGLERAASIQTA
jgi:fatty-acyl-CoA synthase